MNTQRCKQCKKILPIDVHKNTKFCCDECFNIFYSNYHKSWNAANPQIEKTYVKNGCRAYNNIKQRTSNPQNPYYHNYGIRGIRLEITLDEFLSIYFSTNTCANCGIVLNDENRNAKNGRTLDRIDQAQSYKIGNLRILCRSCNCSYSYRRRMMYIQ